MIIDMPATTTSAISKRLVESQRDGGVITLARVMTLVIDAKGADFEAAIATANVASREHPCRIIVIAPQEGGEARLDAEIRVGGDAGASEVIVLRPSGAQVGHDDTLITPLLLPDAPIVAWWPAEVPHECSITGLGKMAQRRITDSKGDPDPEFALRCLAHDHRSGDTDLAWTRLTRWRALLASALEQITDPVVTRARIHGDMNSPSILLLGAWLKRALGCEIEATYDASVSALQHIVLETPSGEISISRPDGHHATLSQPGQPDHVIALPARTLDECLAEELRRLDDDPVYGETLATFEGAS
ncbi:glucose-6-phosphate dehydrogenase assembly protein OpcA [Demequina zhanjiangensis]|uniref:Glucose-6-phosphate dehydrogenase assembly protein OpcA n=1 Tax=Demequina zhanjiangensis TaxID=3051659 RepID=A0ABT8G204_9MICO|nr:glucose-6-phosphate dehydrogenase assembly protein OpcA [Demequina sp. SYSU T00b26]MDN4473174.1 glucose-6-phosphate dehydrogenase assembly protein OpcA [Demequina sp. SYSU T00b26]